MGRVGAAWTGEDDGYEDEHGRKGGGGWGGVRVWGAVIARNVLYKLCHCGRVCVYE